MSIPTRQADRLAQAAAKAKAQRDAGQRKLNILRAAQRKADKAAQQQRCLRWGTILDHLGLLALDEATLIETLKVASRLVQDGRVSWCDPVPPGDGEVQAEIERLLADNVTLVLVRDAETQDAPRHAGSVDAGEEKATTLPSFGAKLSPNTPPAHREHSA
jgi:hypothetical protein